MSNRIRVCNQCYRPVQAVWYFIYRVGFTCSEHGNLYTEETVKIPEDRANYER